jgi:hypothetical protein
MIDVFSQPLQLFGTSIIFLLLIIIYVLIKEKLSISFAKILKYSFFGLLFLVFLYFFLEDNKNEEYIEGNKIVGELSYVCINEEAGLRVEEIRLDFNFDTNTVIERKRPIDAGLKINNNNQRMQDNPNSCFYCKENNGFTIDKYSISQISFNDFKFFESGEVEKKIEYTFNLDTLNYEIKKFSFKKNGDLQDLEYLYKDFPSEYTKRTIQEAKKYNYYKNPILLSHKCIEDKG